MNRRRMRAALGRVIRALLSGSALLLLAACSAGSYPLDIFPEMHYQPSYRPLEPERLSPPEGAVPITGAPPMLTFAQAREVANPVPQTPENLARAWQVYRVNCATCHGPAGDGQGPMASYYAHSPAGVVPPVDLASERVRARTDGELWWIVGRGLGNMPPYGSLLSDDEIWLTVQIIRELQAR